MKKTLLLSATFVLLLSGCNLLQSSSVSPEEKARPIVQQNENQNTLDETSSLKKIIDQNQSLISFIGKKGSAISHEGKFTRFDGSMVFDQAYPDDITHAQIELMIYVDSIETENEKLTQHLLSDDFFNAPEFPQAYFASTKIIHQEGDTYTIEGDLSIKDVTAPIALDMEINNTYAYGEYTLERTVFDVGEEGEIDTSVPMTFKLLFQ